MQEKLLFKFDLPIILSTAMLEHICVFGYRKTGNKFSVSLNGSKGYLSYIEISCEGYQVAENRIFIENLRNKSGSFKKVLVNIFYSDKNGVRVSTGKDEPQTIENEEVEEDTCELMSKAFKAEDSDLPF